MKKLTKLEKFGLLSAVIVACTFFYLKKVYEPQEKRFKKTVKKLNAVIQEVNALQTVPSETSVKRATKKYQQELDALNEKFGDSLTVSGNPQAITRVLRDINSRVDACGLHLQTLSPGGPVDGPLLQWSLFKVELTGDFSGFLHFVRSVKDMPEAIKIDAINITKNKNEQLLITMDLLL